MIAQGTEAHDAGLPQREVPEFAEEGVGPLPMVLVTPPRASSALFALSQDTAEPSSDKLVERCPCKARLPRKGRGPGGALHAVLNFARAPTARCDIRPNRVRRGYGLVIRLLLLSTPPRGDAVAVDYILSMFVGSGLAPL